jgi:hypothetical protein
MNKLAHGIVLAFFATTCWFYWAVLQMPSMVRLKGQALQLPAFTRFCIGLGTWMAVVLPIVAAAYCLWVWIRKGENRNSWVAFLATATAALLFVTLPAIVAIYLPLVNALNHLPAQ